MLLVTPDPCDCAVFPARGEMGTVHRTVALCHTVEAPQGSIGGSPSATAETQVVQQFDRSQSHLTGIETQLISDKPRMQTERTMAIFPHATSRHGERTMPSKRDKACPTGQQSTKRLHAPPPGACFVVALGGPHHGTTFELAMASLALARPLTSLHLWNSDLVAQHRPQPCTWSCGMSSSSSSSSSGGSSGDGNSSGMAPIAMSGLRDWTATPQQEANFAQIHSTASTAGRDTVPWTLDVSASGGGRVSRSPMRRWQPGPLQLGMQGAQQMVHGPFITGRANRESGSPPIALIVEGVFPSARVTDAASAAQYVQHSLAELLQAAGVPYNAGTVSSSTGYEARGKYVLNDGSNKVADGFKVKMQWGQPDSYTAAMAIALSNQASQSLAVQRVGVVLLVTIAV